MPDLPAKALHQALNDFSRLTGLSVVYTDEAHFGLQAPAIKGRLSADQALQQLLAHSGFNVRRIDATTYALEPKPTGDALNLGATSITSQMQNDTTYQPPATSSVMRGTGSSMETPQTINVVAAQVIRDQAPRNLDDALNNISGITGRLRLKGVGGGVNAADVEARMRQQLLQGLICTQATFNGRCLQAKGRLIGVDHTEAGQAAEIV